MGISDWSSDVCSSDLALAQLLELVRDMRDAIRIALAVALPIFLMIVFGRPETVGKLDRGDDRLRPFRLIAFDRGQRGVMLHLILREDRRAILRADIIALPVELGRSEEHTSELQSLMRISYAVFCLKKK